MSDDAVIQIKEWLQQMANVENDECDFDENFDENSVDKNVESDEEPTITEVRINNVNISAEDFCDVIKCQGEGSLTLSNGDYFVGEFFGSVFDREGTLTKLKDAFTKTSGRWKNGLLEVNLFIFFWKLLLLQ